MDREEREPAMLNTLSAQDLRDLIGDDRYSDEFVGAVLRAGIGIRLLDALDACEREREKLAAEWGLENIRAVREEKKRQATEVLFADAGKIHRALREDAHALAQFITAEHLRDHKGHGCSMAHCRFNVPLARPGVRRLVEEKE